MNKKRVHKGLVGVLVVFTGLLVGLPFFLEARIAPMIRQAVNRSINGTFDFAEAELSLIKSFPKARIALKDAYVLTNAPFEGDTLLKASGATLVVGIGELFRDAGEQLTLEEVTMDQVDLRLKVNGEGRENYLISAPGVDTDTEPSRGEEFTFSLQEYRLNDSGITYEDLGAGMALTLTEINHSGSGDLSLAESTLQTRTDMKVSFSKDSVEYLTDNVVSLTALIGMDFRTDTYTFLKNEGSINQMPLVFEGSVRLLEDGQEIQLHFETPDSDFANFLALVPEAYSGNLEGVTTRGSFSLQGDIAGVSDASRIPSFEIWMEAREASYQYPDLPKGVEHINFRAALRNETGQTADTYLEVADSRFTIDRDTFQFNGHVYDFTGNTRVDARLNGQLDLGNISRAYPVQDLSGLRGRLQVDLRTAFDMEAIETKRYDRISNQGTLEVEGMQFGSTSVTHPVEIQNALLRFDPSEVRLTNLQGSIASSDFRLKGVLRDYLPAFFSDADLKGSFDLYSQNLVVEDFMAPKSEVTTPGEKEENRFKIPAFLDLAILGRADLVHYDDLQLSDLNGELQIRDQRIVFKEVSSKTLEGTLALTGELRTGGPRNEIDMDLGVRGFNISKAFASVELLRTLAPIARSLEGRLNAAVSLSGGLQEDFSPDLMSLTGLVDAEVSTSGVGKGRAPVLEALDSQLGFIDLEDLNLKSLKTSLSFQDGRVRVKPFKVRYKDIDIQVSGEHSFDQQLNYKAVLQVPSRYLGPEVNRLMDQLNDPALKDLTIPVTAEIGGNYTSPQVRTDLTSGVEKLGADLVALQKQRVIDKGSAKAEALLGGLLAGQARTPDSTRTPTSGTESGLGAILKEVGETDPTDSTAGSPQGETAVKKAARDLMGGLFGKKKKDTTRVVRDSLN